MSIYACSIAVKSAAQRGPAIVGWAIIAASIGWMVWQFAGGAPPPPVQP